MLNPEFCKITLFFVALLTSFLKSQDKELYLLVIFVLIVFGNIYSFCFIHLFVKLNVQIIFVVFSVVI